MESIPLNPDCKYGKRIIWIEHSSLEKPEIIRIQRNQDIQKINKDTYFFKQAVKTFFALS